MCGFEHTMARHVVDIGARRDANTADLGGQGVGQVVAVEVHGGDDVELGRTGQDLLQRNVGNGVLDEDLVAGIAPAVLPANRHVGVLLAHEIVAPLLEGALGELHDVALVHPVHPAKVAAHGVVERGPLQTLRTEPRDGLDADAGVLPDLPAVSIVKKLDHPLGLGRTRLDLHTGVDVFGVLSEDHHVNQLRLLDW